MHAAGQVQMSLTREAVVWKRGILVMPLIVNKLVKAMQAGLFLLSTACLLLWMTGRSHCACCVLPYVSSLYTDLPCCYIAPTLAHVSARVDCGFMQLCTVQYAADNMTTRDPIESHVYRCLPELCFVSPCEHFKSISAHTAYVHTGIYLHK